MRVGILAGHQSVSSSLMGSNLFTIVVAASMKIHLHSLTRQLSRANDEGDAKDDLHALSPRN